MKQYLDLMRHILDNGVTKADRTGTGTKSVFGYQMRFNLAEGFPLLTTKKLHMKSIVAELIMFIRGDTNIQFLKDNNVHIWDAFADNTGSIGPGSYGAMWRNFGGGLQSRLFGYKFDKNNTLASPKEYRNGVDQLSWLLNEIKTNPDSRRLIITAWNPQALDKVALPPCHCFMQFYVANGKLSCQMYQRSADTFLGVPFNIASYALLTMLIAKDCGLGLGELVHTLGDAHLYLNHIEQTELQLTRDPKPLPQMVITGNKDIWSFGLEHYMLVGYDAHPSIKAPVSV